MDVSVTFVLCLCECRENVGELHKEVWMNGITGTGVGTAKGTDNF
jgi:hypothetical protein